MSKLWTPENAGRVIPVVRVRPLLPPPPTLGARLRAHHMHWQVGKYVEDLSFGPGGRGRRKRWVVDQEAEQHNLVLNQTYDFLGTNTFGALLTAIAIGTGSTPPDPSQTSLAAEFRRKTGEQSLAEVAPGKFRVTITVEFTEAEVGGGNYTEWGSALSATANQANLTSRELFRDAYGNPIVVSVAPDQRLRIVYAMQLDHYPVTPTPASINIEGIGVRTGNVMIMRGSFVHQLLSGLDYARMGARSSYHGVGLESVRRSMTYVNAVQDIGKVGFHSPGHQPYVAGSYTRSTNPTTWANAEANITIRGFYIGFADNLARYGGFFFVFDQGQEFTKQDTHRLTIGPFTTTWGP